ncbi:hypothetical protein HDV05_001204 [Chytridiales sp. JEL 0842]|nr:hypothetical protein HDV05_001204 [Chytridiales sp. JEL 0842]
MQQQPTTKVNTTDDSGTALYETAPLLSNARNPTSLRSTTDNNNNNSEENNAPNPFFAFRVRRALGIALSAALVLLVIGLLASVPFLLYPPPQPPSKQTDILLSEQVSKDNVMRHLQNLENIAKASNGSRSTVNGHRKSVEYIAGFLKNHTDFKVWTQPVKVLDQVDYEKPYFASVVSGGSYSKTEGDVEAKVAGNHHQNGVDLQQEEYFGRPSQEIEALGSVVYKPVIDFGTFGGTGSGSLKNISTHFVTGCDPTLDLAPFAKSPLVALIPMNASPNRNPNPSCSTWCSRAAAAVSAGAKGIIMVPSTLTTGYPRPLPPSLRTRCTNEEYGILSKVPGVGVSQALGYELTLRAASPEGLRVDMSTKSARVEFETFNVLADAPWTPPLQPSQTTAERKEAEEEKIVIITAHLDSVPSGPGINDDASGTTAILEIAHTLHRTHLSQRTRQRLRFAWWAAEETGLQGSKSYVADLVENHPTEFAKIRMNVDIDMIASPNFVRGVWDGHAVKDERIRVAGGVIQDTFVEYFQSMGLATVPFEFNGRSDFVAFMERGVPAGGVITGEDEIKSAREAEMFGGIAGMVLDPCYHQSCDTVESLRGPGEIVLEQNLRAIAHVVQVFGMEDDIDKKLRGEK